MRVVRSVIAHCGSMSKWGEPSSLTPCGTKALYVIPGQMSPTTIQ